MSEIIEMPFSRGHLQKIESAYKRTAMINDLVNKRIHPITGWKFSQRNEMSITKSRTRIEKQKERNKRRYRS